MSKPMTMKALDKLAKELLSPNHRVEALFYPRGALLSHAYGGTPNMSVRTGDSASSRLLMERAIREMGAMMKGKHEPTRC